MRRLLQERLQWFFFLQALPSKNMFCYCFAFERRKTLESLIYPRESRQTGHSILDSQCTFSSSVQNLGCFEKEISCQKMDLFFVGKG